MAEIGANHFLLFHFLYAEHSRKKKKLYIWNTTIKWMFPLPVQREREKHLLLFKEKRIELDPWGEESRKMARSLAFSHKTQKGRDPKKKKGKYLVCVCIWGLLTTTGASTIFPSLNTHTHTHDWRLFKHEFPFFFFFFLFHHHNEKKGVQWEEKPSGAIFALPIISVNIFLSANCSPKSSTRNEEEDPGGNKNQNDTRCLVHHVVFVSTSAVV